ncbi:hypothetical protein Q9R32_16685 [Actinotalea sp. AC32]|nr:hypothetical protein [Actinotalea sp. AC32]
MPPVDPAELATLRLTVTAARQVHERALRDLRSAEVHADFWREPDGSLPVVDQALNPDVFAEVQGLQPALDAASAAVAGAEAGLTAARAAYDEAARTSPLFADGSTEPVLLLPVRLEAVYVPQGTGADLRIRVYPDDVHVDSHEEALTPGERTAGTRYWRDVTAADDTAPTPEDAATVRRDAWRALVEACGGARATWVRLALAPPGPGEGPPDPGTREEAWTRAARTAVLPDHFVFSAYRAGRLVWRRAGEPVPDVLGVGLDPHPERDDGDPDDDPDSVLDPGSRWLADFDAAVRRGMGLVVHLDDPEERFDLLTAVGVGQQDPATGAARVDRLLEAHAFAAGLSTLPVGTPTNNTPGSRSGWRSRGAPPDPEAADARRAAFDPAGDDDAARLARALGVDGRRVLAAVTDPVGGDERLIARLNRLQADHMAFSPAFGPRSRLGLELVPVTAPWYATLRDHVARHVRPRGPLPTLRVGRQPYGVLPVSSLDLWHGDDVDPGLVRVVASFAAAFADLGHRAVQIGEGTDQDAVLLDVLSREPAPGRLEHLWAATRTEAVSRPPRVAVGAVPASMVLAWLQPVGTPVADRGDTFGDVAPVRDLPPDVAAIASRSLLARLLALFDEGIARMRESSLPPDPDRFDEVYVPAVTALEQLRSVPTRTAFHTQALDVANTLRNIVSSGPAPAEQVAERARRAGPWRDLFAQYATVERDVARDLAHGDALLRDAMSLASHRVDAWVTSLATARLAGLRAASPTGLRTGAYGLLTDVEPVDPHPAREGYVVTPSMHHATTAAVLRSGWSAHSDRGAFAVDLQSARVRHAEAMVQGVRQGQPVAALLGYQFERALHDARLDVLVAPFRAAYPLPHAVEDPSHAALVAVGARDVVDGQALRRDAGRKVDAGEHAAVVARLVGELDETFDAVADLLLAEGVHQLVGGNPVRAGVAADGIGRGQELPGEYDVLRTPRSGVAVTHHVGVLLPDRLPPGWPDDRPLVRLEPGVEAWLRSRLGPAASLGGAALAGTGWCATELVLAPERTVREVLATDVDPATVDDVVVVCDRLRAVLAGSTPLTTAHLAPTEPDVGADDLEDLRGRVGGWLAEVRAAVPALDAVADDAVHEAVARMRSLGLAVDDVASARALLARTDLTEIPPPPPADRPVETDAWRADVLARTAPAHPALRVVPTLARPLPPPPDPPVEQDAVDAWLRDAALVRPRTAALQDADVAAELLRRAAAVEHVVAQPVSGAPGPWLAQAPASDEPRPRTALVLAREPGQGAGRVRGIVVDGWTEVVPAAPGDHGPEEVVGVAFEFDRPGARAPHALLLAVPPDPARGWCAEDLHACVDELLLLARVRSLDLADVPELRTVLPVPSRVDS